jgi:hypothetical protein
MLARIKIRHIRLKHDSRLKLAKPTTLAGLDLFEQGDPGYFVKKEPSPFKDMKGFFFACLPEVLDINGDGKLDMLLADKTGVRYYENNIGLQEKTGKDRGW